MIRSGWGKAPLRRLLLVSAAAMVPAVTGCQAGNNAPTINFHYPTDAAGTVAGDISIRNVFILGAPLGSTLQPGQSAGLFFALVNTGSPDRLVSITAPGSAASVQLPGGGVAVDPLKPVLFSGPQAQAYLVDLTRPLGNGTAIPVTLTFQNEGSVTLQVPVMAWAANLTTLSPPPGPAPNPSASPSPTSPSDSASPARHRPHHRIAIVGGSPGPASSPSPSAS